MILAIAGGVGGAKLVVGLSRCLSPENLTIIGNTGDDLYLLGLRVCPDLDTLVYSLAGLANPETGWGRADDSFRCLGELKRLGQADWFKVGDLDLATHLFRTHLLNQGIPLSEVTEQICRRLGVNWTVLPMAEGYHPTWLETDLGRLHIQDYFVREGCRPRVEEVSYSVENARPPGALLKGIKEAEAIVICPSNPFLSVGPILSVPQVWETLRSSPARKIAVSPLVGGRAIKGPLVQLLQQLGYPAGPVGIARFYLGLIDDFVIDSRDEAGSRELIESMGMRVHAADTLMTSLEDRQRVAKSVLALL